ncbi:hypothetical protein HYPSUDRAFT_151665, partial [Hypholoma sublateritium FD-334 SS-4]
MSTSDTSVATRRTDPFMKERVKRILSEVTIGADLSELQHEIVRNMIAEFADCFALEMSEVTPVHGAEHKLNLEPNAKFRTKPGQRPLSPPQKEYLNKVIDTMLKADIIRAIDFRDVK